MRKTISLTIEAAIIIAVGAYFVVEGFSGNTALTVVLLIFGLTSFAMFFATLFEGRKQRQ